MLQGSFKVQTPSDGQVIDLATHIMTCSGAQVAFLQLFCALLIYRPLEGSVCTRER